MGKLSPEEYVLMQGSNVVAVAYSDEDLELVKGIVGAEATSCTVSKYKDLSQEEQDAADDAARTDECPFCGYAGETWYLKYNHYGLDCRSMKRV